MNLKAIKICRNKGKENEWNIGGNQVDKWLDFENINLIVGKNASGKSRTVDTIRHIADLFSGDRKISDLEYNTAIFELRFENGKEIIDYCLEFEDEKIIQEILLVDGQRKLNRKEGKLFYEGANDELDFQTDDDILAITKRDKIQHSFFEKLYYWGKNLSHYRFGTYLGKDILLRDINLIKDNDEIDFKNTNKVTEVFYKGNKNKSIPNFEKIIIEDMQQIGYPISKIDTKLKLIPAFGITVQECDLQDITDQIEMSQGMFRDLSLLIQLNYSLLTKTPSCILIDDIGEGLDYERSQSLINLIIKRVENNDASVQVIMTTNDRFVMNNVPLKYWSVIRRTSGKAIFYNYKNSKETFDDFSLTRLNNFEFFSTDFFEKGFEEYVKDVE
jgi:energy-coupling factor transporter ATP-binding protein EcfA2